MSTPSCQISTPNRIVVFEYEVLKVFVCKSDTLFLVHPVVLLLALPGASDGLFTRRPVLSGEVVSFYSGFIIHCDSALRALNRVDYSDKEEHERNMYNIALDTKVSNFHQKIL